MVISGIGPLGCIPSQLVRQKSVNGECSDYVNNMIQDFNFGLKSILEELDAQFTDAKIVYADSFNPVLNYVHNPTKYGNFPSFLSFLLLFFMPGAISSFGTLETPTKPCLIG